MCRRVACRRIPRRRRNSWTSCVGEFLKRRARIFYRARHALSRRGLVPPRQTPFRPDPFKGDGNALLLAASSSLRGLTSAVRLLANEAEKCGGDWREAITFVRNMAPTIWQRLPRDTQPLERADSDADRARSEGRAARSEVSFLPSRRLTRGLSYRCSIMISPPRMPAHRLAWLPACDRAER